MFTNFPCHLKKFTNPKSYTEKIITQGFMDINEDNVMAVATTGRENEWISDLNHIYTSLRYASWVTLI